MDQEHSLSIKVLVIFLCVFIILVGILPAIIYSSIFSQTRHKILHGAMLGLEVYPASPFRGLVLKCYDSYFLRI